MLIQRSQPAKKCAHNCPITGIPEIWKLKDQCVRWKKTRFYIQYITSPCGLVSLKSGTYQTSYRKKSVAQKHTYSLRRAARVVYIFPGLLPSGSYHSLVLNLSGGISTVQFLPSSSTFQKLSIPSPIVQIGKHVLLHLNINKWPCLSIFNQHPALYLLKTYLRESCRLFPQ